MNKFASAAPPKICEAGGHLVATNVPYYDRQGGTHTRLQMLCVPHSVDTAVWKFIRSMPSHTLDADEIAYLLLAGYSENELVAEGLMPAPAEPLEC